jgi:MFS family permease
MVATGSARRASGAAVSPPPPAYRQMAYLRYVAGQGVSVLGDQVWYVALSWTAVRLASPGAAGAILAVSSVPRLALLLFGGAIVDRYGPRRLMIGSDAGRLAVSLGAAAVGVHSPGVPLLIAVALVFGLADAVFLPAAGTMVPLLLRPEQLSAGNAMVTMTARLALAVGAPLGGLLVAVGGLPLACVVNGATFAASALALLSVHPRRITPTAVRQVPRSVRGSTVQADSVAGPAPVRSTGPTGLPNPPTRVWESLWQGCLRTGRCEGCCWCRC